jgi:cytochrome c5
VFAHAAAGDPEAVYLARCQYCHVQLGPGTITIARRIGEEEALLASRTDLTEDYIKTVVRGGLNTMPAITRVEVSDEELELIAGYLTRNNAENE